MYTCLTGLSPWVSLTQRRVLWQGQAPQPFSEPHSAAAQTGQERQRLPGEAQGPQRQQEPCQEAVAKQKPGKEALSEQEPGEEALSEQEVSDASTTF